MKIVWISIRNFRGISAMDWAPAGGFNCLIGPGDSTKTTILDAIELALSPRANYIAQDSDLYNHTDRPATVTVTLAQLPDSFSADDKYGLHMRGWDSINGVLHDEPAVGMDMALSVRVMLDPESLEATWSLYTDRVDPDTDPPVLRYKDARTLSTTRLGPYAERHLSWARNSVLGRIGDPGKANAQLAAATRAARESFKVGNKETFAKASSRAELLSKFFSVPVRAKYAAELDLNGAMLSTGGVALHDGNLPLRTLGTGSTRLLVSALQHGAGEGHVALIDEIEQGLEPHRIARLISYLRGAPLGEDGNFGPSSANCPQVFATSHSPVVIRELTVKEIHSVRSKAGVTTVTWMHGTADNPEEAQKHLRRAPEAFLARRILVGEGRTECGLLRGLDALWAAHGRASFAYQGVVAIDGGGVPQALQTASHLLTLGYDVFGLLDSDQPPSSEDIQSVTDLEGKLTIWPGATSTEQRLFLDAPWALTRDLVALAAENNGEDGVRDSINAAAKISGLPQLANLQLATALDVTAFRQVLGAVANKKEWFKRIDKAERVAELLFPRLEEMETTPTGIGLAAVRKWVDG